MKNTIFTALILLAGILTSCGSVKYFGIETFTPAEITFPETVETVVIVNNAVPQPKKPGYKYTIMGVEQDTTHMVADSALYDACKALGEAIADQPFFKDVRLYNDAMRQDDLFFQDTKLTPDQVETICDESGAEAIRVLACVWMWVTICATVAIPRPTSRNTIPAYLMSTLKM